MRTRTTISQTHPHWLGGSGLGWLLAALVLGQPALAGEEAGSAEPAPPVVDLDRLLQLPSSYSSSSALGGAELGGANAEQWRARFVEADQQLTTAKSDLADAKRLMEENAGSGGDWNMSAPGVQASSGKDSASGLPLRQRIRKLREEVDEAERSKRGLEVEADLAGVPARWRE